MKNHEETGSSYNQSMWLWSYRDRQAPGRGRLSWMLEELRRRKMVASRWFCVLDTRSLILWISFIPINESIIWYITYMNVSLCTHPVPKIEVCWFFCSALPSHWPSYCVWRNQPHLPTRPSVSKRMHKWKLFADACTSDRKMCGNFPVLNCRGYLWWEITTQDWVSYSIDD